MLNSCKLEMASQHHHVNGVAPQQKVIANDSNGGLKRPASDELNRDSNSIPPRKQPMLERNGIAIASPTVNNDVVKSNIIQAKQSGHKNVMTVNTIKINGGQHYICTQEQLSLIRARAFHQINGNGQVILMQNAAGGW